MTGWICRVLGSGSFLKIEFQRWWLYFLLGGVAPWQHRKKTNWWKSIISTAKLLLDWVSPNPSKEEVGVGEALQASQSYQHIELQTPSLWNPLCTRVKPSELLRARPAAACPSAPHGFLCWAQPLKMPASMSFMCPWGARWRGIPFLLHPLPCTSPVGEKKWL